MVAFSWLWIPITVFAAFVQNIRSAAQKHLTSELNTISVTMVRFLFGLPFGLLCCGSSIHAERKRSDIGWDFIAYTAMAGASQIIATALLVYLFSLRNFAVGTAYARTEAFLTAIVGALFFSEAIVIYGWGAILISVSGVILITVAKTGIRGGQLLTLLADKSAWIGIVCGLFFAIASLTMRKATHHARYGRLPLPRGVDDDFHADHANGRNVPRRLGHQSGAIFDRLAKFQSVSARRHHQCHGNDRLGHSLYT